LGRGGIREAYETGSGSIVIRSKCHIEERSNGLKQIVVTEVPYQVNKATMVENIGNLVRDKVIEGISDIRDVSNKDGVRIIIEIKRDAIAEVVLNQLYKLTSLQVSYGIINLCLVNNAPKICSLSALLNNYLEFQIDVVRRRTQFYLEKDTARDHIVVGLLKCHDNIDDIVDIIKESATPEDASNKLIAKYGFTDLQVQAILGMTLRRLTGIETDKLEAERAQLEKNIAEYNRILSSRENIIEVIAKELTEIKERFGDERRTTISDSDASIDDEDLIPQEDIIVTLSRGNYIKRLASDTFRAQHRGGRGIKGMSTNEHDIVEAMLYTKTHTDLLMFTSFGRVYRIRGYQIPEFNRNSKGIPVINLIPIEKEEKLESIVPVDTYDDDKYLMFFTEQGLVKKTPLSEFANIRSNGKIAISLKEGDTLLTVKPVTDDTIVGIAGSNAKMVNFIATEARPMGRDTMGVRGIDLPEGEKVVGVTTSLEGRYILSITNKGFGKLTDIDSGEVDETGKMIPTYRITKRGAKGVTAMKTTDKIGNLIAVRAVSLEDDLMAITNGGIVIRTHLSEIRLASRNTQGVKIVNLEPRQKVVSIAIVPFEDESEEAEEVNEEVDTEEVKDGSDVVDTSLE
nr:DNA gyrase subunit A [Bacilli bacterium]